MRRCFQRFFVSGAQIAQLFPMLWEMHLGEFQHRQIKKCVQSLWLADRTLSATGLWWLCYQENYCTYCLLCRKHDSINVRNTSKVWNEKPSVRLRKVAIADHLTTEQHKNAVNAELLQRISCFHEQLKAMRENNETIIEKTFAAIYWFARQEISDEKL